MRHSILAVASAALAITLAGCTTLSQDISAASTVYQQVKDYYTDAPKAVYALKGGYIIVGKAVAQFKTTECPAVNSQPWCATLIPQFRSYNAKAGDAINAAEAFVKDNPTLSPGALYNAAVTATETFAKFATDNGVPAS